MAVAHAVQCPYYIEAYTRTTLDQRCSTGELTEAVHVACAIRGGVFLVHGMQMRRQTEKISL